MLPAMEKNHPVHLEASPFEEATGADLAEAEISSSEYLAAKHPIINRLTGRYTLEALARGAIAFLIMGTAATLAILLITGAGIREVTNLATGEVTVVKISDDPIAMAVVGSILTLAATIGTHYFRSTD